MSRDEARQQLQGTFNFEVEAGQVMVRDELLLREIANLLASQETESIRASSWRAGSPAAGRFNYQGAVA